MKSVDALKDALVVEADPLLHRVLQLCPGARLEALPGAGARGAEEPVVLVEPFDQDSRDLSRHAVGEGCDSLSLLRLHEHTVGQ